MLVLTISLHQENLSRGLHLEKQIVRKLGCQFHVSSCNGLGSTSHEVPRSSLTLFWCFGKRGEVKDIGAIGCPAVEDVGTVWLRKPWAPA